MKRFSWELKLGLALVALSVFLYGVHYAVYGDLWDIFFWALTNLAFLPISVLFVSLFIERLQIARETSLRLEKLNMLIGTFFGSAGRQLLATCLRWDPQPPELTEDFRGPGDWSPQRCRRLRGKLERHAYAVDLRRADLPKLKAYLESKTDLLLRLLENPFLLEHESFADGLRAVFHLADELAARDSLAGLPEADLQHLAGDIKRVYALLALQWLDYMRYLQRNYPYLFSLAMRMNPFDPNASAVVGS